MRREEGIPGGMQPRRATADEEIMGGSREAASFAAQEGREAEGMFRDRRRETRIQQRMETSIFV